MFALFAFFGLFLFTITTFYIESVVFHLEQHYDNSYHFIIGKRVLDFIHRTFTYLLLSSSKVDGCRFGPFLDIFYYEKRLLRKIFKEHLNLRVIYVH